jgi:lipoate-protein ligase A
MAVDETLLSIGTDQPILRLYAWHPGCLSLGYGQRTADVDQQRLAAAGIDLVRRPTGGRAILHADELTYCVIFPAVHPLAAKSVLECYQQISQALIVGLGSLGLQAELEPYSGRVRSGPVCFDTPSAYEITVCGRKLIGSAQLRRDRGVLQHGSLPLWGDIARICDVLAYRDEAERDAAKRQLYARATTLSSVLGDAVATWEKAAAAIITGFEAVFQTALDCVPLTERETGQVEQLAAQTYANPRWTYRR